MIFPWRFPRLREHPLIEAVYRRPDINNTKVFAALPALRPVRAEGRRGSRSGQMRIDCPRAAQAL